MLFHAALGRLDGTVQPGVLQLLAFLDTQAAHNAGNTVRAKEAHQVVLQGHIKPGGAGIALTRTAPAQLAVNSARLVPFGADHV